MDSQEGLGGGGLAGEEEEEVKIPVSLQIKEIFRLVQLIRMWGIRYQGINVANHLLIKWSMELSRTG